MAAETKPQSMLTPGDKTLIGIMLISAIATFFMVPRLLRTGAKEAGEVVVSRGGRVTSIFPIDVNRAVKIKDKENFCKIVINKNRVHVSQSNCPNKLCVSQGWIAKTNESIICLPHNLVISVVSDSNMYQEIDAVIK